VRSTTSGLQGQTPCIQRKKQHYKCGQDKYIAKGMPDETKIIKLSSQSPETNQPLMVQIQVDKMGVLC
jgi:hypothetical protein